MTTQQIIAAAFCVAMLAWTFWPALSSLAGRVRLPSIPATTPPPADQDLSDLAALKQVQARFQRLQSKDGQAACLILFENFFREHTA